MTFHEFEGGTFSKLVLESGQCSAMEWRGGVNGPRFIHRRGPVKRGEPQEGTGACRDGDAAGLALGQVLGQQQQERLSEGHSSLDSMLESSLNGLQISPNTSLNMAGQQASRVGIQSQFNEKDGGTGGHGEARELMNERDTCCPSTSKALVNIGKQLTPTATYMAPVVEEVETVSGGGKVDQVGYEIKKSTMSSGCGVEGVLDMASGGGLDEVAIREIEVRLEEIVLDREELSGGRDQSTLMPKDADFSLDMSLKKWKRRTRDSKK